MEERKNRGCQIPIPALKAIEPSIILAAVEREQMVPAMGNLSAVAPKI